jgi:periplasmic protein TonB
VRSAKYFLQSLLLHIGLVAVVLVMLGAVPGRPASERLRVELYGTIADRQAEARMATPPSTAPAAPAHSLLPARRGPTAMLHRPPPERLVRAPEGPVEVGQPLAQAPVLAAPGAAAGVPEKVKAVELEASSQQKAQTLSVQDPTADALKEYIAGVRKRIQARLDYPQAARKAGYEGAPVVRFTITDEGRIRVGTLQIARSSGYDMLDANALSAAQGSEPFERPPREMDVAIAMYFGMRN